MAAFKQVGLNCRDLLKRLFMVAIPAEFTQFLGSVPALPLFVVLLIVSLLLIFAGRSVVKALAFIVLGVIGAAFGGVLGAQYLGALGSYGGLVGLIAGFVIGGLVGLLLLHLGIALALGYGGYALTLYAVDNGTAALVVAVIFFVAGWILYNRILSVVTAVAGGFLLFDALGLYLDPTVAAALAVLVTIIGIWLGVRRHSTVTQP
jgi:hypothetical protein